MNDAPLPTDDDTIEPILEITQDVSARVQELMRKIDRLPPGVYELMIEKQDMRAASWQVNIVRLERIDNFRLSKYIPE